MNFPINDINLDSEYCLHQSIHIIIRSITQPPLWVDFAFVYLHLFFQKLSEIVIVIKTHNSSKLGRDIVPRWHHFVGDLFLLVHSRTDVRITCLEHQSTGCLFLFLQELVEWIGIEQMAVHYLFLILLIQIEQRCEQYVHLRFVCQHDRCELCLWSDMKCLVDIFWVEQRGRVFQARSNCFICHIIQWIFEIVLYCKNKK